MPSALFSTAPAPRPMLWVAVAVSLGTAAGCSGQILWLAPLLALASSRARALPAGSGLGPLALLLIALACAWRGHAERVPELPLHGQVLQLGVRGTGCVCRVGAGALPWELPQTGLTEGEQVMRLARGRLREGVRVEAGARPCTALQLEPDELLRLAPAGASWLPRWDLTGLRAWVLRRLALPDAPTAAGMLRALLVGDRAALGPELPDLFTRTGTRHLLALSGLHVGLVAWLMAWPLGSALLGVLTLLFGPRLRRLGPEPLRALLVLAFVPLSGGNPATTRAVVALALAAVAPRLRTGGRCRRADALSLWATALVLELALHPQRISAVGVQLSYLATLGLLAGMGPVRGQLRALLPGAGTLRATGRLGHERSPLWRIPLQRTIDLALDSCAASLVATLASLPVLWQTFGEFSPWGVLATPLAMLFVAPLMLLGWLHVGFAWSVPPGLLEQLARGLCASMRYVDALPCTPLPLPVRPWPLVALASASILACAARPAGRRIARLASLAWGLLLVPWCLPPAGLELRLLDVGHGTAVLFRTAHAGCWLFDAGSRDRRGVARAVSGVLRRWEAPHVSVVLSHDDRDHSGALPWLLERWPVALRAGAPMRARSASGGRLDLASGDLVIPTAGALELRLLRGLEAGGNEGSRSLELGFWGRRILLSGDAEQDGLAGLLERDLLRGPLDVLLMPHHGSDTPYLAALLERTRPRQIWISCGASPELGPELRRRGLPFVSTHLQGPQQLTWAQRMP